MCAPEFSSLRIISNASNAITISDQNSTSGTNDYKLDTWKCILFIAQQRPRSGIDFFLLLHFIAILWSITQPSRQYRWDLLRRAFRILRVLCGSRMEIEKGHDSSGLCSQRGMLQDQTDLHSPYSHSSRNFYESVAPCVPTSIYTT